MTRIVRNTPNIVRVAIASYDGVQMSSVLGIADLFAMANRYAAAGGLLIETNIVSSDRFPSTNEFDALIVPPNISGKRGEGDAQWHHWISKAHAGGATACSACAGAFWLGHAGLLSGRPATTHWALESEFRAAFPQTDLQPEHLLIDDNDIVTAGGVMAWLDLCLHLVRRWQGPEVVSKTCRHMLIDPHGREQRNYRSFRPRLDHQDAAIRNLQYWLEGHPEEVLSVARLAKRTHMSQRNLQRRFSKATGLSIIRYVQMIRIERARGLLERTSLSVSEICHRVGYDDPSAFSRLFKATCGLSASEYRNRFSVSTSPEGRHRR